MSSPARRVRKACRPRIEALEARRVLSTISMTGGTLSIVGTPGRDRIQVGPARGGGLRVVLDGRDAGRFADVSRIVIDAGGGDDVVRSRPTYTYPP